MIYLHKILPVFLMPTTIAVALMIAGLAFRRHVLCWAGLALLWVAATPFVGREVMRAAEGWQVRQPVSAAPVVDAIVVLSYGLVQPPGDPKTVEWQDPDRFFVGVELFNAGKAPLLIFTGGWVPWRPTAPPEGQVLSEYAARLGVPRERILVTSKVTNTEEEGRAVAAMLAKRTGAAATNPRILLVTSAYHVRRARLLFERAGIHVLPFAVDFKVPQQEVTLLDFLPSAAGLEVAETALRELCGLAYYRVIRG